MVNKIQSSIRSYSLKFPAGLICGSQVGTWFYENGTLWPRGINPGVINTQRMLKAKGQMCQKGRNKEVGLELSLKGCLHLAVVCQ